MTSKASRRKKVFSIDRPDPDRNVTDESLADDFTSGIYGYNYRKYGAFWELPRFVRNYLRGYEWLVALGVERFEATVQRVTRVLRSRSAKKATKTLKANKKLALEEIEKNKQRVLNL